MLQLGGEAVKGGGGSGEGGGQEKKKPKPHLIRRLREELRKKGRRFKWPACEKGCEGQLESSVCFSRPELGSRLRLKLFSFPPPPPFLSLHGTFGTNYTHSRCALNMPAAAIPGDRHRSAFGVEFSTERLFLLTLF